MVGISEHRLGLHISCTVHMGSCDETLGNYSSFDSFASAQELCSPRTSSVWPGPSFSLGCHQQETSQTYHCTGVAILPGVHNEVERFRHLVNQDNDMAT